MLGQRKKKKPKSSKRTLTKVTSISLCPHINISPNVDMGRCVQQFDGKSIRLYGNTMGLEGLSST